MSNNRTNCANCDATIEASSNDENELTNQELNFFEYLKALCLSYLIGCVITIIVIVSIFVFKN